MTENSLRQARPLPEQVIVKPKRGQLNPDIEWDDREMCIGHIISAGDYIFPQSGAAGIFYEYEDRVRAWMAANHYTHTSDLKHDYLAVRGLHGIWSRA